MAPRRPSSSRTATSVAAQSAQLALAVPAVVAHRVTRMALAGPMPSERDRKEFQRMGAEKVAAFQESWAAMTAETVKAQQRLAMSMAQSLWFPWTGTGMGLGMNGHAAHPQQLQASAMGVLEKGMAPVSRRAVANAKRLRHTPLK